MSCPCQLISSLKVNISQNWIYEIIFCNLLYSLIEFKTVLKLLIETIFLSTYLEEFSSLGSGRTHFFPVGAFFPNLLTPRVINIPKTIVQKIGIRMSRSIYWFFMELSTVPSGSCNSIGTSNPNPSKSSLRSSLLPLFFFLGELMIFMLKKVALVAKTMITTRISPTNGNGYDKTSVKRTLYKCFYHPGNSIKCY